MMWELTHQNKNLFRASSFSSFLVSSYQGLHSFLDSCLEGTSSHFDFLNAKIKVAIYVAVLNPIEFASALGDVSLPKPDCYAASLRVSATPVEAPLLSLYRHSLVQYIEHSRT